MKYPFQDNTKKNPFWIFAPFLVLANFYPGNNDYMTYPNRDHGIREGKGTPLHLRVFMVRYLLRHLPAGPR